MCAARSRGRWPLARANVITALEAEQLVAGLNTIQDEIEAGRLDFNTGEEDIHTLIERRLGEIVGAVAGKLHTGRSRNDQVATDFRLWMLDAIEQIDEQVKNLQAVLIKRAELDLEWSVMLPGYTHFQRAQPILLSHWWLSHFWPLQRDRERLGQLRDRTAVSPLGAGALAGTAFPIDREALARESGFRQRRAQQPRCRIRSRFRRRVFVCGGPDRRASFEVVRSADLVLDDGVWFHRIGRCLLHRIEPDAAEEESRSARTDARQSRNVDRTT